MRIALLTIGSRGDVQPFVSLGTALRARGHEVVLGAPELLRPLVERAGLEYRMLPGDPAGFFAMPEVIESLRRSPFMRDLLEVIPSAPDGYDQWLVDQVAEAGRGVDAIVYAPLAIAAAYGNPGVPWAVANWWPNTMTSAFPAVESNLRRCGPLTGVYNLLTHARAAQEEWRWRGPEIDGYRRRLGLPEFGQESPFLRLGKERPYLYPYSPSLLPKPADWARRCHVTGYWFTDEHWDPAAELVAFLAEGPPPVVLTYGSTWTLHRQRESLEYGIAAARAAGRRLVVVDGPADDLPPDVLRVHDVNYRWLFSHAAAVIHHGGFGTTAEVVRAGVPQVIVPVFADHPFWAKRLAEVGAGAEPVPFRTLNADALVRSTVRAVQDTAMARKAAELGGLVRAERGTEVACEVLESWVAESAGVSAAARGTR